MDMVHIIHGIGTVTDMVSFMATSGHNLYLKAYVFVKCANYKTHPLVYERFQEDGLQVVIM